MTATICTCHNCHDTVNVAIARETWERVTLANRGGRVAYLCPTCAAQLHSYSTDNDVTRGKAIGGGFTYSIEFECHNSDAQFRVELYDGGFIPTSDCTTDCEFKSPIYTNLKPIPKRLQTIERLINDGHACVTDEDGTHMHIGHVSAINWETMPYVRDYYAQLFGPLLNAMISNHSATVALYGRWFNEYASDSIYNAWDRYNFVNVTNNNTVEFRLCKFHNAAQYTALLNMHKAMVSALINNFIKYIGSDHATLSHKADIAGGKIAKLFVKTVKTMNA